MRICILGDNLSSLTVAKALVNQNIYVDIIVQQKYKNFSKLRTIGISKSNIEFFNQNIINIDKLLWKVKKIEIFKDDLKDEKIINFQNKDQYLFSILKNNELYKILNNNLSKSRYFKKKLITNKKVSYIDKYKLIINCDYFNTITKKYFSKKIEKKYNSYAYATIIQHDKILNNIATQIFTKKGPLAFLPLSSVQTSIVYSINDMFKKNTQNIKDLIKFYNPKYKIKKIHQIENFELSSLNLRSYHHNNILAFGDLLHKLHPLAGQGYNMTLRDIIKLLQLIKFRIDLGLDLDSSICLDFEKEIKHKNYLFSNGIDFIYEFFNFEIKVKSDLLSETLKFLSKNKSFSNFFKKAADTGFIN